MEQENRETNGVEVAVVVIEVLVVGDVVWELEPVDVSVDEGVVEVGVVLAEVVTLVVGVVRIHVVKLSSSKLDIILLRVLAK